MVCALAETEGEKLRVGDVEDERISTDRDGVTVGDGVAVCAATPFRLYPLCT